jgi:hypothetical protein
MKIKTIDEARRKANQGLNHRDEWDSPVEKKHAVAVFLPVMLEATTGSYFLH